MRPGTRLRTGLLVVVVFAAVLSLGVVQPKLLTPGEPATEPRTVDDVRLVGFEDHPARLWAYTSRERSVDTATLPINVVVKEDAATTRRVIEAEAGEEWTTDHEGVDAVRLTGSGLAWRETTGATRYTYVRTDEGGEWMDETTQVHDGSYLGARSHVRFYEFSAGGERWTALQAHHEHWDWFRLRHTVGSVARGQYTVEHEFYGTGLVSDISRERFGNGGALDADGWVTVVDLVDWRPPRPGAETTDGTAGLVAAGLALVLASVGGRFAGAREAVAAAARQTETTRDHALFVAALLVTPLAVRVAAIALERALPAVSPKVVAAPGYLVLAVGLPLVAGTLGRRLPADEAFAAATVGLGAGLLADYAYLGIQSLRVGVVGHRVALLLGIGLVAAGGVRWAERPLHRHGYRVLGSLVWVAALVWPLVGL
jgi:hypothetical protein